MTDPDNKVWVTAFSTAAYRWSAELLRHTALSVGGADHVVLWTPEDIKDYTDAHTIIFRDGARGYGFFAWKPEIMLKTMELMADEDWLMAVDAGIMFEGSIKPYIEAAGTGHSVFFRVGEAERHNYINSEWTKPDTFDIMGCQDDKYKNCYQVLGGVCMFRKCPETISFLENWRRWCVTEAITDDGCAAPQAHRHDQSILTCLVQQCSCVNTLIMRDCSQFGKDDPGDNGLTHPQKLPTLLNIHRKQFPKLGTTTVITATTGRDTLQECIQSVQAQTLHCVEHLIVADGPEASHQVETILKSFKHKHPIHVLQLPYSIGKNGWNGHRVFGAAPYLCDSDYVTFLDDDNWVDPDHLLKMMRVIRNQRQDASFSLRQIHNKDGTFLCNDECESLGNFTHSVLGPADFFCDTSTMLLPRDLAIKLAPTWNKRFRSGGEEADRAFSRALLSHKVVGVPEHTLHYRLGSDNRSVQGEFFQHGNSLRQYNFSNPNLYVFHFNRPATDKALSVLHDNSRSWAYDEWQMTLLKGLPPKYNLMNGFTCADMIPTGSIVLCNLCNPADIPLQTVFSRTDLKRVCFTLESPNARHAAQWDATFLRKHFDVLLTYWAPLLEHPIMKTVPCLHNTHHLNLNNPLDREAGLRQNRSTGRSVCMVLENRKNQGAYRINGIELHALDHLREHYVKDLSDTTVFGVNWHQAKLGSGVKVGHSKHRSNDSNSSVDHYVGFCFALIIENCDAAGYVSEKLMDSFSAGCIALYYGNNNDLTDIPTNMYIDISQFADSAAVQKHIDKLTDSDIEALRNNIYKQREQVLAKVSTQAHADKVAEAVAML